ncbi:hypothetical protein JKP75_09295 [Blastococcus sp. TML/M2B]|uniref:hypothetical protein n=1 Tax=unclassified Blastococcus TaxID=2619396 RepID=UPI00190B0F24|nr:MULTISPECIES: hypothetical protein [unclassified Blastococcus]MBN1092729.1 hypothetical protein [Blastococcus sp. TML/M2B]MBN1097158.1 hypothetical protein [Blastococcus sp. TML/C7B]MCA0145482.1 hypothetical protein [Blastococcus sp. LR1]
MVTTLRQLLDDLTDRAGARPAVAAIEDVSGALAHLGRALSGLAEDGLTPGDSHRQRNVTALAAACTTAGRLWPHSGGPLTDLAGAAADLIGLDRSVMGRSHRWAATVEVAEVADHCARLGRRLLPEAAAPELDVVRQLAVTIERDAQADPPTGADSVVLDRLVPLPGPPSGEAEVTVLDAAAGLLAALDRAQRADDLTLRDFRAAVAAAELTSRYAAVAAGMTGRDAGPLLVAGLAWQHAGRASMVFHDGRRGAHDDRGGVVASSQALVRALRNEVGAPADIGEQHDRRTAADAAAAVQQVASHMPVLADHLTMAVERWSRTGQLFANARDLPRMEAMPQDRIEAVIAGRHVRASGADLDGLRQVVGRAADLSTGLADVLHRAAGTGPRAQQHRTDRRDRGTKVPGNAERVLSRAHAVDRESEGIRVLHAPRQIPPSR